MRDWHGRTVLDDLTGKRFGHWEVLQFDCKQLSPSRARLYRWLCRCDCGNRQSVLSTSLKNGRSRSCGCGVSKITNSTHHLTRSYIYRLWDGLKRRCLNPSNKDFGRYGGRGIKVCQAMRSTPETILKCIGSRPSSNFSIDRIDNDRNYSCGTCQECVCNGWSMNLRWATRVQQQRNKRNNKIVVIDGEKMSISEAAERFQLTYATVWQRNKSGKTGFELVL